MKKTPLTKEQLEDCRRLKAIYEQKKKALGISQYTIAHDMGIGQSAVNQLLTGKNVININHASKFSKILKVPIESFSPSLAADINQLAYGTSSDKFEYVGKLKPGLIPVIGEAILGAKGMIKMSEDHSGWVAIHSDDPDAYAVCLRGDDLWPRIKSGEFVLIEPNSVCHAGDEVFLKDKNGQIMIRQIGYVHQHEYQFISINQDDKPITISKQNVDFVHFILGVIKSSRYIPK